MKTYSCISETGEAKSYTMVDDPNGQWVMTHEVERLIGHLAKLGAWEDDGELRVDLEKYHQEYKNLVARDNKRLRQALQRITTEAEHVGGRAIAEIARAALEAR